MSNKYGELYNHILNAKEGNNDSINFIFNRFNAFINEKMDYYNIVDKESCISEVYDVIWKCIKIFKL